MPTQSNPPQDGTDGAAFKPIQGTDPYALFEAWMAEAKATETAYANAVTLATVDEHGMPDARVVLVKEVEAGGFNFYTNTLSAKGRQLAGQPKAALCFHWKALERQVRLRGPVSPVSAQAADAYFASRPRGSQIGAWASNQSSPLASRDAFLAEIARVEALYEGQEVPRPPHWSGYRLEPVSMEFWQEAPFRLHDRLVFTRPDPGAPWSTQRIYP